MKILLLNPPSRENRRFIREGRCTQEQGVWGTLWPPVTLAIMAAVLRDAGHAVTAIDCPARGTGWSALCEQAGRLAPDLVIWSTGTPSIESDLSLAAELKSQHAELRTAVFGTHVTALDLQVLERTPALDFIIRNEPEVTARELAAALDAGADLSAVSGVTFRSSVRGDVVRNAQRPFLADIDELPFPAWDLFSIADYRLPLKGRPFLIVAPQRGCPFRCTFCTCRTYYGGALRKRTPGRVADEIEYDMHAFGVRDFFFWSETFVVDRGYVAALCREVIGRNLNISWTCNSRIDIVDAELLELMAQAGCWMISFGIESADQAVLDGVRKGVRAEQAAPAVRMAKKAGIKTAAHFIFGLPGDTEAAMQRTLALALRLGVDVAQFYCAVPFPGSELYVQALQQGWIGPDIAFERFCQDRAIMELPTVAASAVNVWRDRAYRKYYRSPGTWLRIACLVGPGGMLGLLKTAKSFFGWSRS